MVPVSLKDKYTVTRDESKNACDWVQRVASVLIQLGQLDLLGSLAVYLLRHAIKVFCFVAS